MRTSYHTLGTCSCAHVLMHSWPHGLRSFARRLYRPGYSGCSLALVLAASS